MGRHVSELTEEGRACLHEPNPISGKSLPSLSATVPHLLLAVDCFANGSFDMARKERSSFGFKGRKATSNLLHLQPSPRADSG